MLHIYCTQYNLREDFVVALKEKATASGYDLSSFTAVVCLWWLNDAMLLE